MKIIVKIQP